MSITLSAVGGGPLPRGTAAFLRTSKPLIRIGREPGLDWTLPDPARLVSGRHCEIRWQGGAWWLVDISTNGVFVNGSQHRIAGPHRLADGDRLAMGRYVVAVAIEDDGQPPATVAFAAPPYQDAPRSPTGTRPAQDAPFPSPHEQPADLVAAFCAGAGIPREALSEREAADLAREAGELLRMTAEHLGEMLRYRAAAKAMAGSAGRTVVGAADNNPLKLVPDAADALEIMLGRKRAGYMDARGSMAEAFADLRRHERATYIAMQKALGRLIADLAPDAIEKKVEGAAMFSHKARAWDLFVHRWQQRSAGENGMLDAFLAYFSEAYDEAADSE